MTTIEQLRELRNNLPRGRKDPWWKCCHVKRVHLNKALKKNDVSEWTEVEEQVVNEWVEYTKQFKCAAKETERNIKKTIRL